MLALREPHCMPQQLPDFMLLDEEGAGSGDCWVLPSGLAPAATAPSAPVPISSFARAQRMSPSSELVDSLESSQSLLGASLAADIPAVQSHSHRAVVQGDHGGMRFVPVTMSPQQAPLLQPAPAQYWQDERYDGLSGGFGVAAPLQLRPGPYQAQQQPQQFQEQRYMDWRCHPDKVLQQELLSAMQSWRHGGYSAAPVSTYELPHDLLPIPSIASVSAPPANHHCTSSGISSLDIHGGYLAHFGQQAPLPPATAMRRAASADLLLRSSHRGYPAGQEESGGVLVPALAAGGDSLVSEGSDVDTLYLPRRTSLPSSQSAPSASLMALERSSSTHRSLQTSACGGRGSSRSPTSPRPIPLKIKAARPRPAAGAAAAAAAAASAPAVPRQRPRPEAGVPAVTASPRPARLSAQRSIALSAAAVAEEAEMSDTDSEQLASIEASEERCSGGSPAREAVFVGKKKHNPWSLRETEALVEGVRLLGPSKWAEIKKLAVNGICDLLTIRSAVDLKDKWRNLTRVAKLPRNVLKTRAHKSTSEVPLELLLTVKDLLEAAKE